MILPDQLIYFYMRIRGDHRISPTHITLYFALLSEALLLGTNQFYLRRVALMLDSKIFSRVTYHARLKELDAYGFIRYTPSFLSGQSEVLLLELH